MPTCSTCVKRFSFLLGFVLQLLLVSCTEQQSAVEAFPFKRAANERWGIISANGAILISDTYERKPSAVVGNMFGVQDADGRWWLYDISRPEKPVINQSYTQLGYFFEKVTIAQKEADGPLLIIDKDGQTVERINTYSNHTFVMVHNFSNGLALVYTDKQKYGYLNAHGEMFIPPVYDWAYDFSEGLALVGLSNDKGEMAWQVINKQGDTQYHIDLHHCRIDEQYKNGRLAFKDMKWNCYGFLDRKGNRISQMPDGIYEMLNCDQDTMVCSTENGTGLITSSGTMLFTTPYAYGKSVGAGRIAFLEQNRWGLHDLKGNRLTAFAYDEIFNFHGDRTFVRQGETYSLIDRQGVACDAGQYAAVVQDPVAERWLPQYFLRRTTFGHSSIASDTLSVGMRQMKHPVSSINQPDGASLPAVATIRKNTIGEVGRNHPFYEESRKILSSALPEDDAKNRQLILDYVEHFRTAYTTKDIDFLEQLFGEEALIIVGKVVRRAPKTELELLPSEQVTYNVRNKKEYLSRLKQVFKANREIEVLFNDFRILKHPTRDGFYGVSLKQGYTSDLYSDEGYLFLLWDFRNRQTPLIHVRTWQPAMLNATTPLPAEEVFNLGSFNLE